MNPAPAKHIFGGCVESIYLDFSTNFQIIFDERFVSNFEGVMVF